MLHNFEPRAPQELAVRAGWAVIVTAILSDAWAEVLLNGSKGRVPRAFLQFETEDSPVAPAIASPAVEALSSSPHDKDHVIRQLVAERDAAKRLAEQEAARAKTLHNRLSQLEPAATRPLAAAAAAPAPSAAGAAATTGPEVVLRRPAQAAAAAAEPQDRIVYMPSQDDAGDADSKGRPTSVVYATPVRRVAVAPASPTTKPRPVSTASSARPRSIFIPTDKNELGRLNVQLASELALAQKTAADTSLPAVAASRLQPLGQLGLACSRTVRAHNAKIYSIAAGPEPRILLTSGQEGKLIVWDITKGTKGKRENEKKKNENEKE